MNKSYKLCKDSVIIFKNNREREYKFNTVKGACIKVLIDNFGKDMSAKSICENADKIFESYKKKPFADRGRDIRSLHIAEGIIQKTSKGNYKFTGKFKDKSSSVFTPNIKKQVLNRDGFKCTNCNGSASEGYELMVDHIIPASKNGPATLDNGQTLCTTCNNIKSNYDVKSFGRKMFNTYLKKAIKTEDHENKKFFQEILYVFKKYDKF